MLFIFRGSFIFNSNTSCICWIIIPANDFPVTWFISSIKNLCSWIKALIVIAWSYKWDNIIPCSLFHLSFLLMRLPLSVVSFRVTWLCNVFFMKPILAAFFCSCNYYEIIMFSGDRSWNKFMIKYIHHVVNTFIKYLVVYLIFLHKLFESFIFSAILI